MLPWGPRSRNRSSVTAVSSGAPSSFQLGKSSFIAFGSITAPERMWAPTSAPFSMTATVMSGLICFSRIAAARPEGPAPTTTTSYSIDSRWTPSLMALAAPSTGAPRARPLRGSYRDVTARRSSAKRLAGEHRAGEVDDAHAAVDPVAAAGDARGLEAAAEDVAAVAATGHAGVDDQLGDHL